MKRDVCLMIPMLVLGMVVQADVADCSKNLASMSHLERIVCQKRTEFEASLKKQLYTKLPQKTQPQYSMERSDEPPEHYASKMMREQAQSASGVGKQNQTAPAPVRPQAHIEQEQVKIPLLNFF